MKFAPHENLLNRSQNWQIEQIAQLKLCEQSLKNQENVVLDKRTASTVLDLELTMILEKWLAETVKKFPHRSIQKAEAKIAAALVSYMEILIWMHQLCTTTPTQ